MRRRRAGRWARAARSTATADAGSASVWVLSCCALLVLVATVAVVRAEAVLVRHRAESAADLAALAAAGRIGVASDGCAAARRIAVANRARLLTCRLTLDSDGRSGDVRVTVGASAVLPVVGTSTSVASARAARLPG